VVQSMTTIATNGGTSAVVSAAAIEELRQSLRGQLLRPGESGYDAARTIWNAMIDKRPALVARCAGVADVIRSVNFARDHGLLTSIRGGSHNVAGNAVCDGCDDRPFADEWHSGRSSESLGAPKEAVPGAISIMRLQSSGLLPPAAWSRPPR
jgi:hypothetical protein